MNTSIIGRFPGAIRPWGGGSAEASERDPHHHDESESTAAQRELCLHCTIPSEFCEGTCEDVPYSARYERQKKRDAFKADAALGLTIKELREKHQISEYTVRAWAKEFGIQVGRLRSQTRKRQKHAQNRAQRAQSRNG